MGPVSQTGSESSQKFHKPSSRHLQIQTNSVITILSNMINSWRFSKNAQNKICVPWLPSLNIWDNRWLTRLISVWRWTFPTTTYIHTNIWAAFLFIPRTWQHQHPHIVKFTPAFLPTGTQAKATGAKGEGEVSLLTPDIHLTQRIYSSLLAAVIKLTILILYLF
jgi:hypothetical protein